MQRPRYGAPTGTVQKLRPHHDTRLGFLPELSRCATDSAPLRRTAAARRRRYGHARDRRGGGLPVGQLGARARLAAGGSHGAHLDGACGSVLGAAGSVLGAAAGFGDSACWTGRRIGSVRRSVTDRRGPRSREPAVHVDRARSRVRQLVRDVGCRELFSLDERDRASGRSALQESPPSACHSRTRVR
jgi:hypothetical protein